MLNSLNQSLNVGPVRELMLAASLYGKVVSWQPDTTGRLRVNLTVPTKDASSSITIALEVSTLKKPPSASPQDWGLALEDVICSLLLSRAEGVADSQSMRG